MLFLEEALTVGELYERNRREDWPKYRRLREIKPTAVSFVKARLEGDLEKQRRVGMSLAPMLLPHSYADIRKLFSQIEAEMGYPWGR